MNTSSSPAPGPRGFLRRRWPFLVAGSGILIGLILWLRNPQTENADRGLARATSRHTAEDVAAGHADNLPPDSPRSRADEDEAAWRLVPTPPRGPLPPLATAAAAGDSPWRGHDNQGIRSRRIAAHEKLTSGRPLVAGDKFTLNLFPDVELEAEIVTSFINVNGTVSTTARIADSRFGYAVLAYTDGELLARIAWPERRAWYAVNYRHATGEHYAVELDPDLAETDDADSPHPVAPLADGETTIAAALADDTLPLGDGNVVVDIMVVYTNNALSGAGSQASIDNTIASGISQGNVAHTNTNTGIELYLIHSALVDYDDSGNLSTDLYRLTWTETPSWGDFAQYNVGDYMNEIHDWRNNCGADFVCLMPNGPGGGVAWLLTSTAGSASYAFSVTGRTSFGSLVTAHEIGHNMGLHHAYDQDFQWGPTGGSIGTDAAGWHWHPTPGSHGYCTVMTYTAGSYFDGIPPPGHPNPPDHACTDGLSHTRVALFSDPNITNNGLPAGHIQHGNNARVLRALKDVYAGYRHRPSTGSLRVTINPAGAVTASAQWRLTSGANTSWQNSGTTLASIATGGYTVEFKTITGWDKPANQAVTINSAQTTNASGTYTVKTYTVVFQTDGTPGATLIGTLSQVVNHGANSTAVTVDPSPVGYEFKNWTGSGFTTSTANPLTVTNVTQNLTITANFQVATYNVYFNSTVGGHVTGDASQLVAHGNDSNPVTATPMTGYHFVNWTKDGAFFSIESPLTVTNVAEDLTLVANFALNEYLVTFRADPDTGGTVNGAAVFTEVVAHGSGSSAVAAEAAGEHLFTGWIGNGNFAMINPAQFATVTGPLTVTATFLDTTNLEHLACGSALTVDKDELATAIPAFTKRPKIFTWYYDPVTDLLLRKRRTAAVRVLTKVSPKNQQPVIAGEWIRRIRLYNLRGLVAERKQGDNAAAWLAQNPIAPLPMALRIAAKEADGVILDETIRTVLLAPPKIDDVDIATTADGLTTFIITGRWFGARAPKLWLEYDDPTGRPAPKMLRLRPQRPNGEDGRVDLRTRPIFMHRETGDSQVVVILPARLPKAVAAWTDIPVLVIENGVGLDAVAIPWP